MSMIPFKVLLVEDDTDLREAISATLRLGGVEHEAFECAEDALHAFDPEAEHMLVTDFRLPGMNGLQLAQTIHAEPALAGLKMIILTSMGRSVTRAELDAAGVSRCIAMRWPSAWVWATAPPCRARCGCSARCRTP
jgi:two-component system response regulator FlrC